jgi:hypothetical protein
MVKLEGNYKEGILQVWKEVLVINKDKIPVLNKLCTTPYQGVDG